MTRCCWEENEAIPGWWLACEVVDFANRTSCGNPKEISFSAPQVSMTISCDMWGGYQTPSVSKAHLWPEIQVKDCSFTGPTILKRPTSTRNLGGKLNGVQNDFNAFTVTKSTKNWKSLEVFAKVEKDCTLSVKKNEYFKVIQALWSWRTLQQHHMKQNTWNSEHLGCKKRYAFSAHLKSKLWFGNLIKWGCIYMYIVG